MSRYNRLTLPLTGALVCFIGGAEASPRVQAPMFFPLPLQAGLRCGLVNGRLECGNTNGGGKHHHDGDHQSNDDNHEKKDKDKKSKTTQDNEGKGTGSDGANSQTTGTPATSDNVLWGDYNYLPSGEAGDFKGKSQNSPSP